MKKFGSLFIQDFKVMIRSGFHYAVIGLAVVFILLTHFLLPEKINTSPNEVFFDDTPLKIFENYFLQNVDEQAVFFDDYDSFKEAVYNSEETAGIMVSGEDGNYKFDILVKGAISNETENLIIAALDSISAAASGKASTVEIEYEFLREKAAPIPFNKSFLPIFITFEVIMMGFLLIAVLVFQEKQEGSIRAYRISASGTIQYIFSKTAVITLLGLIYGFFTAVFILGFKADYLALMLIILVSSILINILGLALSVFFKNISEFLIISLAVLTLLQLPTVSYFNPAFSPDYLKWIPSYAVIFGVRQALFLPGSRDYLWPLLLILLIEALVFFGFCFWAVRTKLLKNGRTILHKRPGLKGNIR